MDWAIMELLPARLYEPWFSAPSHKNPASAPKSPINTFALVPESCMDSTAPMAYEKGVTPVIRAKPGSNWPRV
ncbi:MAG: hypothetical protein ACD_34C00436G0006 [uncultured bacterium]|nr:MAG: hypothetical protein ACD_34C00436G0006 [uncultured bacterium]